MALKDDVEALLAPTITDLGFEWVGMELNPHPSNGLLRIYIDREDGIGVEHCAQVSREVSSLLDVHDPIPGHYNLEVSSPGLNRPLFTAAHFLKFVGENAKVTLFRPVDGQRKMKGRIESVDGESIVVVTDDRTIKFDFDNVAKARLVPNL